MVWGGVAGKPPPSVAAVAARWVDRLQLLEVELGNGVQLLRQPRPFQAGRQVVEPGAVFVLEIDQCGYRRRPALGPRWGGPRRRRGRRAIVSAKPGTASRLALGWGHRHGADTTSGHVRTPVGIVTVTFANWFRRWVEHGTKSQFLCSIEAPFLRPDLALPWHLAQPRSRLAVGHRRRRRAAVLTAVSTGPDLAGLGAKPIMPLAAALLFCARPDAACSNSGCLRASSRGSRRQAPAPAASSSPHSGRCAPHGCAASIPGSGVRACWSTSCACGAAMAAGSK